MNVRKNLNKKGFTLAELLIVVAIIAVLVAVAIPVFNAQLEKSRQAVDVANMRAAYAAFTAAVMLDEEIDGIPVKSGTYFAFDASSGQILSSAQFRTKYPDYNGSTIDIGYGKATGNTVVTDISGLPQQLQEMYSGMVESGEIKDAVIEFCYNEYMDLNMEIYFTNAPDL